MADIDFEDVQLGTAPTGVGGDVPRTAFGKITSNFNKVKALFADSSNAASRKVGTGTGDVMQVGAGGWMASSLNQEGDPDKTTIPVSAFALYNSASYTGSKPANAIINDWFAVQRYITGTSRMAEIWFSARYGNTAYVRTLGDSGEWRELMELLHTGNTTTDSNGFIKAASPIIKLFNDKIEKTDHLEIQSAALEKLGTGKYKLTGVPELSRDGWYIETPKDRNNNIYFTLDYEENNGELIIKTYEPDYSSGRAENGEPVDILEGRFVSLRFAENPELYPDPEDE